MRVRSRVTTTPNGPPHDGGSLHTPERLKRSTIIHTCQKGGPCAQAAALFRWIYGLSEAGDESMVSVRRVAQVRVVGDLEVVLLEAGGADVVGADQHRADARD